MNRIINQEWFVLLGIYGVQVAIIVDCAIEKRFNRQYDSIRKSPTL